MPLRVDRRVRDRRLQRRARVVRAFAVRASKKDEKTIKATSDSDRRVSFEDTPPRADDAPPSAPLAKEPALSVTPSDAIDDAATELYWAIVHRHHYASAVAGKMVGMFLESGILREDLTIMARDQSSAQFMIDRALVALSEAGILDRLLMGGSDGACDRRGRVPPPVIDAVVVTACDGDVEIEQELELDEDGAGDEPASSADADEQTAILTVVEACDDHADDARCSSSSRSFSSSSSTTFPSRFVASSRSFALRVRCAAAVLRRTEAVIRPRACAALACGAAAARDGASTTRAGCVALCVRGAGALRSRGVVDVFAASAMAYFAIRVCL